ncbi:MAG: GAF domain-containing protein [Marinifilaceae bacterium]
MKKILVIDNQKQNISIIQSTITELFHNCRVLFFSSCHEILSSPKKLPDLLIINIDLTGSEGLLYFHHLKSSPSTQNIPVIIISDFKQGPKERTEILHCGADGFIKSPIDSIALFSQVKTIFNSVKATNYHKLQSENQNNKSLKEQSDLQLERRLKEEKFQQKQSLLNSILENTDNGLLVIDKHGEIIHSNSKFFQMWGIPEELIQKKEDQLLLDFALAQLINPQIFLSKVKKLYGSYQFDQDIIKFKDGKTFKRISYPLVVEKDLEGRVWSFTDITEKQKARDSLQKLNKAVLNSREVIFITDPEGVFTFVNPEFTNLYGYSSEEVVGKVTPRILKSEYTSGELYIKMWRSLLAKQSFSTQFTNKSQDGRLLEMEVTVDPIINDTQEIIGFLAIQKDVTKRKTDEANLKKRIKELSAINSASKKLQKLNTTQSLAIELASILEEVLDDCMGEVLLISESGTNFFSYSIPQKKKFHYTQTDKKANSFTKTVPLERGFSSWVVQHGKYLCVGDVQKDPRYYPIRNNIRSELCVPIKISNQTIGVINLESEHINAFSDSEVRLLETIANQMSVATQNARLYKNLQDKLKQGRRMEKIQNILIRIVKEVYTSETLELFLKFIKEELGSLIDTTNFYVALYDKECDCFSVPYVADQKVELHYFPAGKSLTAYVLRTKKSALVTSETLQRLENARMVIPVGRVSKVWLGVPLYVNDQVIGVCSVQSYEDENAYTQKDLELLEFVTNQVGISIERKKAEEDLKLALDKAKESDRLKTAFLETMSHELRTPLNAIIGFSDLINIEDSLSEVKDYAKTINQSGHNLLAIVEDILDVTQMESNNIKIVKMVQPLRYFLKDIFEEVERERKLMNKTKTQIVCNYPEDYKESIIATDLIRLKQIFMSLLKNALKFTPEGTIDFGISHEETPLPPHYSFYVKDTGIGIPKDQKQIIFDMFRQGDDTTNRNYGGVGIGLTLAKKLTHLLGGTIWFESTVGEGSIFYFTIPFPEDREEKKEMPQNVNEGKELLS